jgi:hypothetical protein
MCETESSEHSLIDFVLSQNSKLFGFKQLIAALECMNVISKLCREDLDKLWAHECMTLGIDPKDGTVLQHDFIRIATRASLLPGCMLLNVRVCTS